MADQETKAQLLAKIIDFSSGNLKYGSDGNQPYKSRIFYGKKLPGGVTPEEVADHLPVGWNFRQVGPSDHSEEVRETLKNEPDLLHATCFYPPKRK